MKKIMIPILLIATSSGYAAIKLGVEAGITSANISTTSTMTTSNRSGFAVGALLEFSFLGLIYLQPELLYVQKGYVTSEKVNLDYIELPVLLKLQFGIMPIHFEVFAGPSIAVAFSKSTSAGGIITPGGTTSDFKSTDFGLQVGGGLSVDILDLCGVFANIRYSLGLAEISQVAATSVKNNALIVLGGLRFGI